MSTELTPKQPVEQRLELENKLRRLFFTLRDFEKLDNEKEIIYRKYRRRYKKYWKPWSSKMVFGMFAISYVVILGLEWAGVAPQGLTWVALFITLGLFFGRKHLLPRVNKAKAEQNKAIREGIIRDAAPKTDPIDSQISLVMKDFDKEYLGWFPDNFMTSRDVEACLQIVSSFRASTVQEVMNAYNQDLQYQRLNNILEAQHTEMVRANEIARVQKYITSIGFGALIGAQIGRR